MKSVDRVAGSSLSRTEFDGHWIYPRRSLVTPDLVIDSLQDLPEAERFRRCAADVARRCETRIDRRSEVQRKTFSHKLVAP
jgi:hypothetical protein